MSDAIIMNVRYTPVKYLNEKRPNADSSSSISLPEWYATLGPHLFHFKSLDLLSICPYVFSCKMFVKSDLFVYSLEHNNDEKKRDCIFF